MRTAALLCGWCLAAVLTTPQARPGDPIVAARLGPGEAPVLDGTLAHPAWQRALAFEDFVERDPAPGAPPPQRTRVQVLFDDQAVWVGITAFETEPGRVRRVPVRPDGVNRTQDFVVVYLDAIGSRRSAQFFRVSAAGSTADGLHTAADDSEDFAPDFDWDAAVAPHPEGWTAVLRLPFASLRFAEGAQDWRILVGRRLPRTQFHLVTSVLVPREAPSFIATMQPLQGVRLPADHVFLTLRPSVTLRRERSDGRTRGDADASLDVKWRPRAELVVDATLNPDFSQVALDVPQLSGNTRFALSLAEKRPFFFESADLLRSPTEAFYTRSFTAPRGGLRATWRGGTWSGSAFAIDDRGGGRVLLPGPWGTDDAPQPASRSLAARVRADGGAWQAGALAVDRRYADGAGHNRVAGPDLAWQLGDAWRLRSQWLHSHTTAFHDSLPVEGDRATLELRRQTEAHEFELELDASSAGFRHDSGFVNQVGVQRASLFSSWRLHDVPRFNDVFLELEAEQVRDRASGRVVTDNLAPGVYATGAGNLELALFLHPGSRVRLAPERPLLRERYVHGYLSFTPADWFPLLETEIDAGRLVDAEAGVLRPGLRWSLTAALRPLRQLEVEPRVQWAWLRDQGRPVYRETALQGLAVWHLDARQTLRLIVQRGALDRVAEPALEVQPARERDRATSFTYAWRHSAGTVLYVGAGRSRPGAGGAQRTDELFVKLQVDVDQLRGLRTVNPPDAAAPRLGSSATK